MVFKCDVCQDADSKYRCPKCETRYCSLPCYKSHQASSHNDPSISDTNKEEIEQPKLVDRPGTTQRVPKVDFAGFEKDADLQRLLVRYPTLKYQLQLVYGVTLEPGPEEAGSWSRRDWFPDGQETNGGGAARNGGRASRGRGRGRGRGGHYMPEIPPEDRQRGQWSREKGDKQAMDLLSRMRNSSGLDDEFSEGMNEFVELCQMKFEQQK